MQCLTRGSAHWACIAHLAIEWYWSKFQREIIITLKTAAILNGGWSFSRINKLYYHISQLIRYSRPCGSYQDILDRRLLLTRKLLRSLLLWFPLWYLQIFLTSFSMYHSYYDVKTSLMIPKWQSELKKMLALRLRMSSSLVFGRVRIAHCVPNVASVSR
jgi:hypothetical protein